MFLSTLDLFVVAAYAVMLFAIAQWVSREPAGEQKDTEDYFLAGKSLPWWAIGGSLIAANISAEQIIGMSGQGFAVGLAIAAYEWQAALVLIIVAAFFLPIFIKRGIYTMPQFLDQRYGNNVKMTMSVFWLFLYTAVNLTTVLWLGALAVNSLTGMPVFWGMAALGTFAVAYSMYGGLKAVALTDIIQVVILVAGGLMIAWVTMGIIGSGDGVTAGFKRLYTELPGKFEMILDKDHPSYQDLPGIWTLLGGLWVLHFSYWGFNQYIIQRALGAKSLQEAQKGLAFSAFLKLLMPVIIVLPGIAAVMLAMPEMGSLVDGNALAEKSDRAYPEVMKLMPSGIKGLIFAALIAAIVSSLASMMNSISTIFTLDVYKAFKPGLSEGRYVTIGRITAVTAMVIALLIAQPLFQSLESAFQTLQEATGFVAPGIVAVFLMGMFWKATNSSGAMAMLIVSVVANIVLKFGAPDVAFVIRVWIVFMSCIAVGAVVSKITTEKGAGQPIDLNDIEFGTATSFKVLSAIVILALVGIYAIFW